MLCRGLGGVVGRGRAKSMHHPLLYGTGTYAAMVPVADGYGMYRLASSEPY